MDKEHPEIVIIKRHASHEEEHHGGAWKIAFADFMTAMMAFFLVLWIINATDKNTKTIIARYFNPVKLEDPGKTGKSIREDTKGNQSDAKNSSSEADSSKKEEPSPPGGGRTASDADAKKAQILDPKTAQTVTESGLFAQPYETLDKIAGKYAAPSKQQTNGQLQAAVPVTSEPSDPFKPITLGGAEDARALDPQAGAGQGSALPSSQALEEKAPAASGEKASPVAREPQATDGASKTPAPRSPAHAVHENETNQQARSSFSAAMLAAEQLRKTLSEEGSFDLDGKKGPTIEVTTTKEGILISLTDKMSFSMFSVGSAKPQVRTVHVMEKIAQALKSTAGAIVIRGYTDARQYKLGAYDNWRLSSDRAQMAYYMLTRGGLSPSRVGRIEGYADRGLRNSKDPLAAENRRIEILIGSDQR